ncbi:MAG TPA: metallophosphoesterase [Gemmatimonadales bacterium]|nr:metallophosphoesterase [Gemmatimonadales bacterium]
MVPVPGLPRAFAGFRIAQVADLHLFNGVHPAARAALAQLDREQPDLLVLTGDQWDRPCGANSLAAWLRELPAGTEVIAVPGNHDYEAGFTRAEAERVHERGGARLLVNQAAVLRRGRGALAIIGLEDLRSGPADPLGAVAGVDADTPQIWLHHQPAQIDAVSFPSHARAALALGGHTHGGQVRVMGVSPIRPRGAGRYLAGWYRSPIGPYYVSRGVGASGVRIRIGCPPELPVFTLVEG